MLSRRRLSSWSVHRHKGSECLWVRDSWANSKHQANILRSHLMSRVDEHHRINFIKRTSLPLLNLRQNFIGNVADETVILAQQFPNDFALAGCHYYCRRLFLFTHKQNPPWLFYHGRSFYRLFYSRPKFYKMFIMLLLTSNVLLKIFGESPKWWNIA